MKDTGVVVVDVQGDFTTLKNGSLAVPGTDQDYLRDVESAILALKKKGTMRFATQDWHPAAHGSFADNHVGHDVFQMIDLNGLPQVLWPVHCVQGSAGAEFVADLNSKGIDKVVQKGTNIEVDSYSGFADNGQRFETELHAYLQSQDISTLYVLGVATDYCVKFTVLDALTRGYDVFLIVDGCRGVNQNPDDSKKAIEEMEAAGATVIASLDAS